MGSKTKLVLAVVAVVCVATGGWVVLSSRDSGSREFVELVESMWTAGQPFTLDELDAHYDAGPVAAKAGRDLSTLLGLIGNPGDSAQVLYFSDTDFEVGSLISQKALDDSRRHLGQNRDVAARLQEILHEGLRVRYPVDLTLGADAPLEYLAPLRSGTRLLALEATLAALDGDAEKSLRSLNAAVTLADSLRDEPLLISQLVRVACIAIACGAIEESVNRTSFTGLQLRELEGALKSIDLDGMIARALVGDRTWGMADLTGDPQGGRPMLEFWIESWQIDAPTAGLFDRSGYYERETVQLIRDYNDVIALGEIPTLNDSPRPNNWKTRSWAGTTTEIGFRRPRCRC